MIFTKNKMNGAILLLKNSIGFRYFTGTSLTFRPKNGMKRKSKKLIIIITNIKDYSLKKRNF